MSSISELRQDIVSGDWVVIATGRAKRPHDFLQQERESFIQPKAACPFERLDEPALAEYPHPRSGASDQWWVKVVANKYPAFGPGACGITHEAGPYHWTDGVGFHEVVATADHERSLALMSNDEVELVLRAYQERYAVLRAGPCVGYVSVFHNHGRLAGATISHPHSQIIAIPVVPPDIRRSLEGSGRYFHERKACVHCAMIAHERHQQKRLIFENDGFVVFAPFASKTAFEIRIFPKEHSPRFEAMDGAGRAAAAEALRVPLAKLFAGLKNPDYNMFIHTAPVDGSDEYPHYHWHMEILPKTSIWAGFEIGTGIEISTIAPESAAEFLREVDMY